MVFFDVVESEAQPPPRLPLLYRPQEDTLPVIELSPWELASIAGVGCG